MSNIDSAIRAPKASPKSWTYVAVLLPLIAAGSAAADEKKAPDEELQLGQEMFNELKAKGEIIESSPLYEQLKPVGPPKRPESHRCRHKAYARQSIDVRKVQP